jgi:hypothetical protein
MARRRRKIELVQRQEMDLRTDQAQVLPPVLKRLAEANEPIRIRDLVIESWRTASEENPGEAKVAADVFRIAELGLAVAKIGPDQQLTLQVTEKGRCALNSRARR